MFGIFVSYRREDASGYAGRLHESLVRHFGADAVFIDVDSIEPGVDFVDTITHTLAGCEVLIVVIGPRWGEITGPDGRSRLDDPGDFVRIELQVALERQLRIIPVLVNGARMPTEAELPSILAPLGRRQAFELSDRLWSESMGRLVDALEGSLRGQRTASELSANRTRTGSAPSRVRRLRRTFFASGAVVVLCAALIGVSRLRDRGAGPCALSESAAPSSAAAQCDHPGDALLFDQFDNPMSGWSTGRQLDSGSAKYENGWYAITASKPNGTEVSDTNFIGPAHRDNLTHLTNTRIEADARPEGRTPAVYGLVCRHIANDGPLYEGVIGDDGYWGILKLTGTDTPATILARGSNHGGISGWVHIALDCKTTGNSRVVLRLALNGVTLGSVADERAVIPWGGVGVVVGDRGTGGARAVFDNFLVRRL